MKNIFNKIKKGTVITSRESHVFEVLDLEIFPGELHNGEYVLTIKNLENKRVCMRGFNSDGTWFACNGKPHPRDITGIHSAEK